MMMSRTTLIVLTLAAIAGAGWYFSGGKPPPPQAENRAVPVVTATATPRPIPIRVEAVGNVQAVAVVHVRPRVEGEVLQVHIEEGQEVTQGQTLFTLDSRIAEANKRQAEANLARDKAQLDRALADLARYQELLKAGTATKQKVEQAQADAAQAQAAVKADQAAIDNAKLTMGYATIKALVPGRTGVINAKLGSLAKPGDSQSMVTITQMRPINVAFSVAETHLPRIRAAMTAQSSNGSTGQPLEVTVTSTADSSLNAVGKLSFIDSAIDTATGTIGLKASFANDDTRLWPGQFVNVTLVLGTEEQALTIPAEAVQNGQSGTYVFLVDDTAKADIRAVGIDRVVDGIAVVTKGLKAGDKVVTQGQMRLAPGLTVAEAKAAP
ncbi:MAG: efflux RND transporter periplasmic adaptor subunit [Magnetospirillum sp.]|nr:efflux RND transporter periplasmic adaptor subunit [Magnetospirillum sp.]